MHSSNTVHPEVETHLADYRNCIALLEAYSEKLLWDTHIQGDQAQTLLSMVRNLLRCLKAYHETLLNAPALSPTAVEWAAIRSFYTNVLLDMGDMNQQANFLPQAADAQNALNTLEPV